jgi:L-2-hydroxycarboxylate dehydrogenase (NAD+)
MADTSVASVPSAPASASPRVSFAQLETFITTAMARLGLPDADAATVGRLMAQAELQGSDGHGVIRLLPYARRIRAGGLNLRPNISVLQERPGMALLDGDNGMGHLVMARAAEMAIEKARVCGIGWVGARLSNHAGPASLYARMPMAHDMIGLYFAVGNANHLPPWGGLDMLLSTNPIAVAVPAGEEPPVVLDMATTVAAYGKVKAKAQRGEMMPIGGYKGYGLSLIVGLLAGTLNGAAMGKAVVDFNHDDTSITNTGQAIMAIDLSAFGDVSGFKARVDQLVRELRASEKMPGVERIWLPGEQSHAKRESNERDGMVLPPTLLAQLDKFAIEIGISTLLST